MSSQISIWWDIISCYILALYIFLFMISPIAEVCNGFWQWFDNISFNLKISDYVVLITSLFFDLFQEHRVDKREEIPLVIASK